MYGEAIAASGKAKDLGRGNAEATATMDYVLAKSGKREEVLAVQKELEDRARANFIPAYVLAVSLLH